MVFSIDRISLEVFANSETQCPEPPQTSANHLVSFEIHGPEQLGGALRAACPELKDFSLLNTSSFTKVRTLSGGAFGKVILCRMHTHGREDQPVMVKKLENRFVDAIRVSGRAPGSSDPLNEIGVLLKLAANPKKCPFLIELIDVARDDVHTMIVMKHCNDGGLFNVVCRQKTSEEGKVKRYLWQLLQATKHLHSSNIGHQNISLEAILVDDGELRLTEFGQAVKLATSDEERERGRYLRYHHLCGSGYYRAPEVATSEGYEAPAVDVFACGVVLLVLHARCPPWRCALPCDPRFAHLCELGVAEFLSAQHLSEEGVALLTAMLRPEPSARISLEHAASSSWFDSI